MPRIQFLQPMSFPTPHCLLAVSLFLTVRDIFFSLRLHSNGFRVWKESNLVVSADSGQQNPRVSHHFSEAVVWLDSEANPCNNSCISYIACYLIPLHCLFFNMCLCCFCELATCMHADFLVCVCYVCKHKHTHTHHKGLSSKRSDTFFSKRQLTLKYYRRLAILRNFMYRSVLSWWAQ